MNTTLAITVGALLLGAPVLAQATATAALQRALLIEQQEGDLRLAEQEYRTLLAGTDAAVGDAAALHLGTMLWRLGRRDEGKELLQRAAKAGGDVARAAEAVLQDPDPDGKQAEAVAQRVRELLAQILDARGDGVVRGVAGDGSDVEKDLKWLGVAAVPELLRQLEGSRAAALRSLADVVSQGASLVSVLQVFTTRGGMVGPSNSDIGNVRKAQRLAELVWAAGGPTALAWMQGVCSDSETAWRRLIASACGQANDSLLPVAALMLRDADPEGDVPVLALRGTASRQPIEAIVPLLGSPLSAVRTAAWTALQQHPIWQQHPQRDNAFLAVQPALERALAGGETNSARVAFEFLCNKGAFTEAGVVMLLVWLPRVPAAVMSLEFRVAAVPFANMLRCARELGPWNPTDGKDSRRGWVGNLIRGVSAQGASTTELLDLVELGYSWGGTRVDGVTGRTLLDAAVREAKDAETMLRAIRLLPVGGDVSFAVATLRTRELPAEALPLLIASRQKLLDAPNPWRPEQLDGLVVATGNTGNADAVLWLRQQLAQVAGPESSMPFLVAEATVALSNRSADARVLALLRELLVFPNLNDRARNFVFAELAQRGDPEAIPLYPQAYALGLETSAREAGPGASVDRPRPGTLSRPGNGAAPSRMGRGVQWLGTIVERAENGQPEQRLTLHGYAEPQLREALRVLLASPALPLVLVDFVQGGMQPSTPVVDAVVARLPELLAREEPVPPRDGTGVSRVGPQATFRRQLLDVVISLVSAAPQDDSEDAQRYRAGVLKLLDAELSVPVAHALPPHMIVAASDRLRAMLTGPNAIAAYEVLTSANVPIEPTDVVACLQKAPRWQRDRLLNKLPIDMPPEVARAVAEMVRDADKEVRATACAALGRSLATDSIAVLLPALRDPEQEVRTAATEALERIRLYHEQTAYWQQFQQGVTTGREAAAGKLLVQAKPDQPKAQRLLAIGALGALGAAEAAPLLIEWSAEQDPEIAAAARAALARIVTPPANK